MLILISIATIFAIAIAGFRALNAHNIYEKIAIFYLIFSNFIILILISAIANFGATIDIIIILFLLQFITIMFLIFNRKKYD